MSNVLLRERLVKAREFIGCNRKEFAELLGMPYRTITNYENGAREPGSNYLVRVADECGCTTDWLLGLTDSARENSPYSDITPKLDDVFFERIRSCYDALDEKGRERLAEYADDLLRSGKYGRPRISVSASAFAPDPKSGASELGTEAFVKKAANLAREQVEVEKRRASQASSAKESGVG